MSRNFQHFDVQCRCEERPGQCAIHGVARPIHPSIQEAKRPLPYQIIQTAIADDTNQTLKRILRHMEEQIPLGKGNSLSMTLKGPDSSSAIDIIFDSGNPSLYQTYRDSTRVTIIDFKDQKMWNYPNNITGKLPGRKLFTLVIDNDGPGTVRWQIGDEVSSQTSNITTAPQDVFRIGFNVGCIQRLHIIALDDDAHVDLIYLI